MHAAGHASRAPQGQADAFRDGVSDAGRERGGSDPAGEAERQELEREVLEVCNLSQGVRAEGREEGRQEGRIEGIGIGEIRMLVQLVREGDLPLERAAAKAKMTVEQFKETMENTPLQAV